MCVFTRMKPVIEGERGNNETVELTGTEEGSSERTRLFIKTRDISLHHPVDLTCGSCLRRISFKGRVRRVRTSLSIPSSTHPSIPAFIHTFTPTSLHQSIHPSTYACISATIHPLIPASIHSLNHPSIHPPIHPLHTLIHLHIHSSVHL